MSSQEITKFEDCIQELSQPLILGKVCEKNDLRLLIPDVFRSLFESEASTKHIILDSISEYSPIAEVQVGDERKIDILSGIKSASVGVECKSTIEKLDIQQMRAYETSGVLDYLYLVFPVTGNNEDGIASAFTKSMGQSNPAKEAFARTAFENYGKHYGKDSRGMPNIANAMQQNLRRNNHLVRNRNLSQANVMASTAFGHKFGIFAYNPLGRSLIMSRAMKMQRNSNKTYHNETISEEFVKHHVWTFLRQKEYTVAAEAVLENAASRLDVVRLDGLPVNEVDSKAYPYLPPNLRKISGMRRTVSKIDPYRIDFVAARLTQEDSSSASVVGVECKGEQYNNTSGKVNMQLNSYLNSGQLSFLYLAVPKSRIEDTLENIVESDERLKGDLGVLSVSGDGFVRAVKHAKSMPISSHGWLDIRKIRPSNDVYSEFGSVLIYENRIEPEDESH